MLRLYRFVLCSVTFILPFISTTRAHVVYGDDDLDRIRHKGTYVQVGAFQNQQNAINKKRHVLQKHPTYSVKIRHTHNGYYVVLVKPTSQNWIPIEHPIHHHKRHAHRHVKSAYDKDSPSENWIPVRMWPQKEVAHIKPSLGFVGIQGSALWPILPGSIQVNNGSGYPYPYNLDNYSVHDREQAAVGVVIGRMWKRNTQVVPYYWFGARYQHIFFNNVGGNIQQYSMPEFENYAYTLRLAMNTLTAFFKAEI